MRWDALLFWGLVGAQCPQVKFIMINACPGGSNEGTNEFIGFYTGGGMNLNQLKLTTPNTGDWCNSGCAARLILHAGNTTGGTTTPTANSGSFASYNAYINALNTNSGCAGVFQLAPQNVPAGAYLIIFTGSVPNTAFNFSNLCPLGTLYVAFMQNANIMGRFLDNPMMNQNRSLLAEFGDYTGCNVRVNYGALGIPNADGNYVSVESICSGRTDGVSSCNTCCCGFSFPHTPSTICYYNSGNSPPSIGVTPGNAPNCNIPWGVLSTFFSKVEVQKDELVWEVELPAQVSRFEVFHKEDPYQAPTLYAYVAAGKSKLYHTALGPSGAYKVRAYTAEGGYKESPYVAYHTEGKLYHAPYPNPFTDHFHLSHAEGVSHMVIYDAQGRKIYEGKPVQSFEGSPGLYLLQVWDYEGKPYTYSLLRQ
ncbi:MAG: T9SS type A sorting domain-containing protein [Bacteroidia bacterium]